MACRAVSLRRALAVHEAAHAVVAAHLGFTVHEIRIGDRNGRTVWDAGRAERLTESAVCAAGDVGQRLSSELYHALNCVDLARFETEFGLRVLWRAEQLCETILKRRRAEWLALAARLVAERHIVLVRSLLMLAGGMAVLLLVVFVLGASVLVPGLCEKDQSG